MYLNDVRLAHKCHNTVIHSETRMIFYPLMDRNQWARRYLSENNDFHYCVNPIKGGRNKDGSRCKQVKAGRCFLHNFPKTRQPRDIVESHCSEGNVFVNTLLNSKHWSDICHVHYTGSSRFQQGWWIPGCACRLILEIMVATRRCPAVSSISIIFLDLCSVVSRRWLITYNDNMMTWGEMHQS